MISVIQAIEATAQSDLDLILSIKALSFEEIEQLTDHLIICHKTGNKFTVKATRKSFINILAELLTGKLKSCYSLRIERFEYKLEG
jgi:hypothetical protein